ncbi:hypothetical protein ACPCG0_06285 [Propionibacteriaceae bacterium Y1923]|uniref:hypothetical protein n=1 Tax=Aestuariimicrobium sp. Y1814 TaxID=3418742 RepID=UPI003C1D79C1
MTRITWKTVDHAATRWSAVMAVASVIAAIVVALRFVAGELIEAIFGTVLLLVILIGWWAMNQLRDARVTIDETGIRREGRGGFACTWAQITKVGVGAGMVGGDAPYLLIGTTKRRSHNSIIPAAGAGYGKATAAAPIDPPLVDQVEQLLAAKGVLRTEEQWAAGA